MPLVIARMITALKPLLLPMLVGVLIFLLGYERGNHAAATAAAATISQIEQLNVQEKALASQLHAKKVHELTSTAAQLAFGYQTERDLHEQDTKDLKRRIALVTRQYRKSPDAALEPLPSCIFTAGFVSVFNQSIGAQPVPAAGDSAGAAAAAEATEAVDSGIQQADILEHITEYGQSCRDISAQLNKLLDIQESADGLR